MSPETSGRHVWFASQQFRFTCPCWSTTPSERRCRTSTGPSSRSSPTRPTPGGGITHRRTHPNRSFPPAPSSSTTSVSSTFHSASAPARDTGSPTRKAPFLTSSSVLRSDLEARNFHINLPNVHKIRPPKGTFFRGSLLYTNTVTGHEQNIEYRFPSLNARSENGPSLAKTSSARYITALAMDNWEWVLPPFLTAGRCCLIYDNTARTDIKLHSFYNTTEIANSVLCNLTPAGYYCRTRDNKTSCGSIEPCRSFSSSTIPVNAYSFAV